MPSIAAPTHYEHAHDIAPARLDGFFRWLDQDEFLEFTGTTESPTGWVGLIQVTPEMYRAWPESADAGTPLQAGWYIVRLNDDGIVFGIYYGSVEYTLAEEHARADYASAGQVYAEWDQLNYPTDLDGPDALPTSDDHAWERN